MEQECDPKESVSTFRDVVETQKNCDRPAAGVAQGEEIGWCVGSEHGKTLL
jgi:hypothetical protein